LKIQGSAIECSFVTVVKTNQKCISNNYAEIVGWNLMGKVWESASVDFIRVGASLFINKKWRACGPILRGVLLKGRLYTLCKNNYIFWNKNGQI